MAANDKAKSGPQQYLVLERFVYNHGNKVVEQRDVDVIVKLTDEEAAQAGDAVQPLGHDGPSAAAKKTVAEQQKSAEELHNQQPETASSKGDSG